MSRSYTILSLNSGPELDLNIRKSIWCRRNLGKLRKTKNSEKVNKTVTCKKFKDGPEIGFEVFSCFVLLRFPYPFFCLIILITSRVKERIVWFQYKRVKRSKIKTDSMTEDPVKTQFLPTKTLYSRQTTLNSRWRRIPVLSCWWDFRLLYINEDQFKFIEFDRCVSDKVEVMWSYPSVCCSVRFDWSKGKNYRTYRTF